MVQADVALKPVFYFLPGRTEVLKDNFSLTLGHGFVPHKSLGGTVLEDICGRKWFMLLVYTD